jgi:hypothetical protein
MRDKPLSEKLASIGLVDVEYRNLPELRLPPREFFTSAKKEIVISGFSLHNTFLEYIQVIVDLLNERKKVYVMILHPESPILSKLQEVEQRGIKGDIQATLDTIKVKNLSQHPDFKIRFFQDLPLFTGVMVDGDITAPEGAKKEDQQGQIRVRPNLRHTPNSRGLVIQFKKPGKASGSQSGPFDDFANDFRHQWAEAQEDPSLFEADPAAQQSAALGSGVVVQGNNNTIIGAGGVMVGGNVGGDVVAGTKITQNAGDNAVQIGQAQDVKVIQRRARQR